MIMKYPYTDYNEYNLDWCITRIRDLTDEWKATHDEWVSVEAAWEDYKHYFDNLNVQDEIDAKINKMIIDGSFSAIVAPFFADAISEVPGVVTAWINDNLLQETGYVIDNSLTVANAAADAKVTGTHIRHIEETIENPLIAIEKTYEITNFNTSINVNGVTANYSAGTIVAYGTNSGGRYLCCIDGDATVRTTSSPFHETLPAGTYRLHLTTSGPIPGDLDGGKLAWTTTTFASMNFIQDGDVFSSSSPMMVGLYFLGFNNYGTSNNPCVFEFTIEKISAKAYDLYPTGDATDRYNDIYNVLTSRGQCRLAPGDYYVDAFNMPVGTELTGCGNATRLIKISPASYRFLVRMNGQCKIRDLTIVGDLTTVTPTSDWNFMDNVTPCLIRIQGTGTSDQVFGCVIENVNIQDFQGPAIFITKTGYNPTGGNMISNVRVERCNAGIVLVDYAEYNNISNCDFLANYYGCVNMGGNNMFTNCDFSMNEQGLKMDNSSNTYGNNSHGSFTGCQFNHSGGGSGVAIELTDMIAGEMFTGCQVFYGSIDISGSNGIVFTTCNFGSTTPITIDGGGSVIFNSSIFRSTQSPTTITNNNYVHFDNCYYINGPAVTGTPS